MTGPPQRLPSPTGSQREGSRFSYAPVVTEPLPEADATALAGDPTASAEALAGLADDPRPAVRATLLTNPALPADLRYQVHAGLRADAAAGDAEAETALAWLRYDRSDRTACDRPE